MRLVELQPEEPAAVVESEDDDEDMVSTQLFYSKLNPCYRERVR